MVRQLCCRPDSGAIPRFGHYETAILEHLLNQLFHKAFRKVMLTVHITEPVFRKTFDDAECDRGGNVKVSPLGLILFQEFCRDFFPLGF